MQTGTETLPASLETKVGLLQLKEHLKNVKSLVEKDEKERMLSHLVLTYLHCSAKISAKRVLSSFFQSLDEKSQLCVKKEMCCQLQKNLDIANFQTETARHNVGTIAVLMENFKLGEKCLSSIALQAIRYLAEVGHKFYLEVHADVPPVLLNEVMHHCHVTIQTLNLVLQKTVVDDPDMLVRFVGETDLLQIMWDLDTAIVTNEMFLLDCRCCCSMNAFLIMQLALPCKEVAYQIPLLLFPSPAATYVLPASLSWLTETRVHLLNMKGLSTLSTLAVAFGYIATVSPLSVVQKMPSRSYFYLHMLLPALLKHSSRCTDTTSRTLFGKTISLLATKLLECVQKIEIPSDFSEEVDGDSIAMQSLLGYVWTNWEDQLDIVRQSAKVVFEKVLQLHCVVRNYEDIEDGRSIARDPFLLSLVKHLFTVSWTSRGKFSALTSCVRHIGCQPLLDIRPGFQEEIIAQLLEQALSCYASELYCTMFTHHKKEMDFGEASFDSLTKITGAPNKSDSVIKADKKISRDGAAAQSHEAKFFEMWIDPVSKALCGSKKKLKQNIVEYLLPRLLKSGEQVLVFMIQGLSARLKDKPQEAQGAIIMCLHRARTMGFLKASFAGTEIDTLWLGYISKSVLKETLCSMDDHIRLDAFALVCENSKTSEAVSPVEFDMLKFFIPHNLNNQSPAFRQTFLALIKKLLFRVKESLLSLKRKLKGKNPSYSITNVIDDYESFLSWLTMLTMENLYPGAAFAQRTTSLAIVSLLTDFFTSEKDGFCISALFKKPHIQALLECLTDTFEENKRQALGVLTCYLKCRELIWDQKGTVETLGVALSLACSTRPQDCDTAVYIFLVLLKQQEFYHHKFDFAALLSSATRAAPNVQYQALSSCPKLQLLWTLLQSLDSQIAVADQSLVSAAASKPMYPTLHCIRYILQEVDFCSMEKEHMASAQEFVKSLITSCLHLSKVVSPVVQNSSPEGNVPEEAVTGLDMPNAEWSKALVESMPEYLVVCGWRSIKEVSLTLGSLCLQLPTTLIVKEETDRGLLSLKQVEIIGKYFNQQLLESIHRGAFELAYTGFQLMCQMLWSHPLGCFHQLPSLWLSAVLEDIKTGDPQSRLCATRRSAGVPFLVQAITSTEPNLTGRQTFHNAMKELLRLALRQDEKACETEANCSSASDAQVHALNILRALYRESRLGDDVVLYVADGLKAAILGFRSEQWAVRNSATLLLSSLMTRMFGVKRSKDETAMSKKNCQTGRAFFYRYPSLYPFLLSELEAATANMMSRDRLSLHPSLYPVLLVLGRLFPSTLEGSDTSLSLSAFIPYVIRCASSPVYKTRVIASRAIQPLAKRNEVISISQSLWENLSLSPLSGKAQSSRIHGSVLQLIQLVRLVESFHETYKSEALEAFVENLCKRKWIIEKINPCYATRQAALILTDSLMDIIDSSQINNKKTVSSSSILKDTFIHVISELEAQHQSISLPFYFEFEKTKAELCLKHLRTVERLRSSCLENKTVETAIISDVIQPKVSTLPKKCTSDFETKGIEGAQLQRVDQANNQILLSLLKSPVYDVRLGVLDVLLSNISSSQIYDRASDEGPGTNEIEIESELTLQTPAGVVYIPEVETLDRGLYHQLMKMAMESETHHLCLEKTFYLLASLPKDFSELDKESNSSLQQLLSTLIERIQTERRTEVKAAMMRFTVRLVAVLYNRVFEPQNKDSARYRNQEDTNSSLISDCQDRTSSILTKWLNLLKESSSADENPELQISCCHCFLKSANILLTDPQNIFGRDVYKAWNTLAILLQDDDLEVKELAASVVCVVLKKEPGSYQPSYTLHLLPGLLLSFHGPKDLTGVLHCLLSWILQDCTVDAKGCHERLFDKGEMNTYLDHVAFTRSILECVNKLLISGQSEPQSVLPHQSKQGENSVIDLYHQSRLDCQNDQDFVSFLESCLTNLLTDIQTLGSKCQKKDMFMNISRHLSLCQMLYKGRLCLSLFHELAPHNEALAKSLKSLQYSITAIKNNLNVTNILC